MFLSELAEPDRIRQLALEQALRLGVVLGARSVPPGSIDEICSVASTISLSFSGPCA
jgi:hypothetical protein